MEEKIKIYVPEAVNNILLKDMELFEIIKKDGSLNKNDFYNILINNYYQQYQQSQSEFYDYIKESIRSTIKCNEAELSVIASDILKYTDIKNYQLSDKRMDVVLSFKPSKKGQEAIEFIQNCCLKDYSLSGYLRNMFSSYALLQQDKRERIIFHDNFQLVEQAIRENKQIYFTTNKKDSAHFMSPYCIANSKEELFNYLLGEYNHSAVTFRMSRLKKVVIINEERTITDENKEMMDRMVKQGPQYTFNKNENEEIIVRLTDEGKKRYKSMYLHRPQYTKIDDDLYYFECSAEQAFQYFSRFGRQALVIQPLSLHHWLMQYYSGAYKAYSRRYQNNSEEKNQE